MSAAVPTGYRNYLSLNHALKTIPYGGIGEVREDGDANYGFKDIKGDNALLFSIPELKSDSALMTLVRAINAPQTGIFSVGCVSDSVEKDHHFRNSGYIEFSFNSASYIADASNYFPLFFEFERLLDDKEFSVKVEFNWELQPATFIEKGISGYTCTIFLNTYYSETKLAAQKAWIETLDVLSEYLGSIPSEHQDFIFGHELIESGSIDSLHAQ
jgi:hypothetical protein